MVKRQLLLEDFVNTYWRGYNQFVIDIDDAVRVRISVENQTIVVELVD